MSKDIYGRPKPAWVGKKWNTEQRRTKCQLAEWPGNKGAISDCKITN